MGRERLSRFSDGALVVVSLSLFRRRRMNDGFASLSFFSSHLTQSFEFFASRREGRFFFLFNYSFSLRAPATETDATNEPITGFVGGGGACSDVCNTYIV